MHTTRSFHPAATAGIRDAGAFDHDTHAHTGGWSAPFIHSNAVGPNACCGSVVGVKWSVVASRIR